MERGISLTWYQTILLCVTLLGAFSVSFIKADADQLEYSKELNKKIECKLDKSRFDVFQGTYVDRHKNLVDDISKVRKQIEETEKQLIQRMNDSEKGIIRILTRMEGKQ